MNRSLFLLALAPLAACDGCSSTDDTDSTTAKQSWGTHAVVTTAATGFATVGDSLLIAGADGVLLSEDGAVPSPLDGLPSGAVRFLGAVPSDSPVFLAQVDGRGLYRHDGSGWSEVSDAPDSSLLGMVSERAMTLPFGFAADPDATGEAWIAAAGGIFHSSDSGDSWSQISIDEGFNLIFTDVAVDGDTVVATAFRPAGILPADYQDLLTGHVFISDDGGVSWDDGDPDISFRYPAAVDLDADGSPWVAAMDGGLFVLTDGAWTAHGGPSDAVGVAVDEGGVSVISATRGPWRLEGDSWTAAEAGPMVGLEGDWALAEDGTLFSLAEGEGQSAPEPGGATVHIALSFHVNLYHSYRGDSNTDDGYGIDLDVMRAELDWLDARPEVHGDWDIENHFSLDGWMASDGADVLERIQERVASGQDGVRLMSWNNGAVAAQSREEFDASIAWAQDSLMNAFGEYDPGVQPQECMFTQEHVGWYRDLGVEWITLFYSGTPFTALRQEMQLPAEAWYAPSTIATTDSSMTLVPAYHHGDLIDHGGLAGWAQQIHESQSGDQLLLIHFDADAESWEAFDQELDAAMELDFVEFTTIQDYLDSHDPVAEYDAPHDMADGTGDGWQSWAEKAFNQEIATGIAAAREAAIQAETVAGEDPDVQALLDAALEHRLLALSTTHFGLAAPFLHEDRQQRAREYVQLATQGADEALVLAVETAPLDRGDIAVINTRDATGTALVELTLRVHVDRWEDASGLHVYDEDGLQLPIAVTVGDKSPESVALRVSLVLDLESHQERILTWDYDTAVAPAVGDASVDDFGVLPLVEPFTECAGEQAVAELDAVDDPSVDDRGVVATETTTWDLALCDGEGTVSWSSYAWDGLPGTVIKVSGAMGTASDPEDAESVALSPLLCEGAGRTLTWRTYGGAEQTRAVRQDQWTWNGQAVDGWVELACEDRTIQVSHRVVERSSLAFAPLRTIDGTALLAPLGTLWADPVRHDVRRTGGHGIGDVAVGIIGSQFEPAAPDWSGQAVGYRLLVGSDIDHGTLDLFAHPPLVRLGSATGGEGKEQE